LNKLFSELIFVQVKLIRGAGMFYPGFKSHPRNERAGRAPSLLAVFSALCPGYFTVETQAGVGITDIRVTRGAGERISFWTEQTLVEAQVGGDLIIR
jgi:hypothetical protein